jgi:hypothetical protein
MVKKNLTIKIPKPEIKKIIVKPQIPPPVDSNFTNLKI